MGLIDYNYLGNYQPDTSWDLMLWDAATNILVMLAWHPAADVVTTSDANKDTATNVY